MKYGLYPCSACGDCYHMVLADRYDPNSRPNGTWFRLLKFYRDNAWPSFPTNDPAVTEAGLVCPGCGAPYLNVHGRTLWYDVGGQRYGAGPKAHQRLTRPKGVGFDPDFDFFSGEELGEKQEQKQKKKKPGKPKKKREALKQLGQEQMNE